MKNSGFTLIEMVVVIALTTLIMIVLSTMLVNFYKTNAYVLAQTVATDSARRGVEDVVKYVREASIATDSAYPIQSAATSSVSFYADTNNDGTFEQVTYAAQDGTFIRTITGSDVVMTLATNLTSTSTPLFQYYDSSGAELTTPITLSRIATVKITLMIELDRNRGYAPFTLSGTATLRNAKMSL